MFIIDAFDWFNRFKVQIEWNGSMTISKCWFHAHQVEMSENHAAIGWITWIFCFYKILYNSDFFSNCLPNLAHICFVFSRQAMNCQSGMLTMFETDMQSVESIYWSVSPQKSAWRKISDENSNMTEISFDRMRPDSLMNLSCICVKHS